VFLNVEEHTASRIEEELLYGRLNIGISFVPASSDEIGSEALFDEELVLIVSSRHRLAKQSFLKMTALEGERLILLPTPYHPRHLFDEKAAEIGIRPKVVAEMNSIEGILAAVKGCGGATVLPNLAMSNKTSGLRQDCYRCKATEAFKVFTHEAVKKYAFGLASALSRGKTKSTQNRTT
jgi:DNA-binding transcriptional LysR family regulator